MIRTPRDQDRALLAAYREGLGLAAIAVVGAPAGAHIVAGAAGAEKSAAAAPAEEIAPVRWWCRHPADAARIAAAAMRRLRRKADAGVEADAAADFSLACAAVRDAANRFAIVLQSDAALTEEAMGVVARVEAELEKQRQAGGLKAVNAAYRRYRLETAGRGERALRYDRWMLKYKENLVRQIALTLRQI